MANFITRRMMANLKKSKNLIPRLIGDALTMIFGQEYENDIIALSNGKHEIEIEVDQCCRRRHECDDEDTDEKIPGRIWVSFDDEVGNMPVCGGNVDTIGVVKTERGFILYANIHSTSRVVRWFASLS
jgi:hypothetical protein